MRKTNLLLSGTTGVCAMLGILAFGPTASSQTPGPFTQAQVDAGRQAYAASCASCHQADLSGTNDAPQLAGSAFIGAWKGRTTQALYNKISKSMPANAPGSLDETSYSNITAFMLRANGATPGSTNFTSSTSVGIGAIADGKLPTGLSLFPAGGHSRTAYRSWSLGTSHQVRPHAQG